MGLLAESKSRKSIGKDPNNTKWTRDTTTFGQKILRSHGWEPGQYLGAKDAPHSELHTAANASYIRVALKDDMKGLGYSKSKEDEVTGLDVFSDLLSRLNGKSQAQVEQDQAARLEFKTNRYVEQKWGPMRFVSGGLLVGDVMEKSDAAESPDDASAKKRSKRKADSLQSNPDSSESDGDHKRQKREKKRRKEAKKAEERKSAATEDGSSHENKEDKRRKREKRAKRERRTETEADSTPGEETAEPDESGAGDDKSKQSKRDKREKRDKKDKKDKKEKKEKKDRKDRKREKGESKSRESEGSDSGPSSSGVASGKSTPVPSGTSTPVFGRNFVRSRFIAQKQRVLMDTEALKQILMIKT